MSNPKLLDLYEQASKHSGYQILAPQLRELIGISVQVKSRSESERLDYIHRFISMEGKAVMDIGGNTGYFTFQAAAAGATSVDYYEGNPAHAHFVELAARQLQLDKVIHVHKEYYYFDDRSDKQYDITFLLNVLHHLGDDYGKGMNIEVAKQLMQYQLDSMAERTECLIFQIGFNWCGNREQCLFKQGTKREMIDFVSQSKTWRIAQIGIARSGNSGVYYEDLNDQNVAREDSLGEFLNRPLFILKRSRCQ